MNIKKTEEDMGGLSFESALAELEKIVSGLESGEVGLDKAMEFYSRGQLLKEYCTKKLSIAKLQVEKITGDTPENMGLVDFNNE